MVNAAGSRAIVEALRCVVAGGSLSEEGAASACSAIIRGEATPAQIGGLLVALRMKGESLDEISGFVRTARAAATALPIVSADCIDTCGTGGDGSGTFNISTVAAFVAAGAGCKVAKHGNRASSSACGSADVLEALGVHVEMPPEQAARCIEEIGIGFLFAPQYHPGARHAVGPRRELGVRTIFNTIGPLANPAGARRQLMGIYDSRLTETVARVLARLGSLHVWVVSSEDGLDELSIGAPTRVSELRDGAVTTFSITPEECDVRRGDLHDLAGGDANYNAAILREVLDGAAGPRREIVVLNAGAAIYIAGVAPSIREGVARARESIDSGAAARALESLVQAGRSGARGA